MLAFRRPGSRLLTTAVTTASVLLVASSRTLSVAAQGAEAPNKSERIRGAVLGSLIADSLCLGSHYEYDAKKIKAAYGGKDIDTLLGPGEKMGGKTHGVGWGERTYHPGQKAGDNTDYGLGTLFLLEYFAKSAPDAAQPFSVDKYVSDHWLAQYEGWRGGRCRACAAWLDTMVKTVLTNLDQGAPLDRAGGMSNGQVVRFAGALGVYDSEERLVQVARDSTKFTNRNPQPIAASEFWARCAHRVMKGEELEAAVRGAAGDTKDQFIQEKVQQAINKVKEATDPSSSLSKEEFVDDIALTSMARLWEVGKSEPIKVGKASPTEGTLPGAVYFILKYKDYASAARANAMVGGDNASRSIPIGLVLGALQGHSAIPAHWLSAYKDTKHVEGLLDKLPLYTSGECRA